MKDRTKPFEELREQLAVLRDKAVTSNGYNLIELLIEDTYEADRPIAAIADRRDLEIAVSYEQRILRQAQELTVTATHPEPLIIPASYKEDKPVGDIWELVDAYCHHQAVTKQWSDPEKQAVDIRRLVELSGLKTTADINKTNAGKFKLLVQERYSGTSVKTNYKKVSAFIQWIVRNTEYIDVNIWKAVDDLKSGKPKKKTPITPELWSQIDVDVRFTATEKRLMRVMYWTGFSIKEAMSTKANSWVTIDNIPCLQLDQGKTDNRLKPLPVHAGLMPLWGLEIYSEGKSVQSVTRTINNKLEHYACSILQFP